MTTLSVISHDDRSGADVEIIDSAPGGPRQVPSTVAARPSQHSGKPQRLQPEALPETLLELPDLVAASEYSADRWSTLGNRVFWIGIVLGSLGALVLILSPRARAPQQLNEAPTWNGSTGAKPSGVSSRVNAEHGHDEHGHDDHGHDDHGHADRGQEKDGLEGQPPNQDSAPSYDLWSQQPTGSPAVYTARGSGDRQRDGAAPRMRPGEAAPTGTIYSTTVNQ